MSRHWRELPERGTPLMLRAIRWIGLRLGRPAGRLLLYPITGYFLVTAGAPRRASRDFLGRVLGREPSWLDVFRHIHCFAATILDRVYFLSGQFQRFELRIHNRELLLEQARSGAGCLLLGSHLGSFEVLRCLGVLEHSLRIKVLMRVEHNQAMMRVLDALNPGIAATVIPLTGPESLLRVKESLDEGYLVGALGDRVMSNDKSVRCDFLGRPAEFPTGPLLLAALAGCPVLLCFGLYRGGNCYDIHFERLTDGGAVDRRTRPVWVREQTGRYVQRLEHHARQAPYNWFNFYDFWRDWEPP